MFAMRFLSEAGPNTELVWLLLVAFGLFFLMVLVGWWASGRKKSQPEVVHEAHEHKAHEKSADNLVKIEGIGPKVAKILNGAGILTFADLAQAKSADVQKILNAAGLQMMNPEGWIDQAKLAAKGDWAAFEKMQGELKGGRKK
jgi:hypothetical protein